MTRVQCLRAARKLFGKRADVVFFRDGRKGVGFVADKPEPGERHCRLIICGTGANFAEALERAKFWAELWRRL